MDLIKNKHGKLLLSKKDIAQEFQETFFEGKHLETLNFDESMSRTVSGYLDSFDDASEHVSEVFHEPFTMEELNEAMKQSSDTNSFDPDDEISFLQINICLGIQNLPLLFINSISSIQSFLSYKLKSPVDSFLATKFRQSNRKWVAVSSVMRQEHIGLAVKLLL